MSIEAIDVIERAGPAEHAVHLYDRDDELISIVGDRLVAGVLDGRPAILIATTEHLRAFEQALTLAGVDVAAQRAAGMLITLDPVHTFGRFMIDGAPEPEAFERVIGSAIRDLRRRGDCPIAFGEMVALLWDAGNVTGALALEELWEDLLARERFTLLCAYPRQALAATDPGALADVCGLHAEVLGHSGPTSADPPPPWRERRVNRHFACSVETPRAVRRFTRETLARWGRADLVEDATAIVSELASNAVLHARSDLVLMISTHEGVIRVAVQDRSPVMPRVDSASPEQATTGRGVAMIAALSAGWGSAPAGEGKRVWADLRGGRRG